MTAVKDQIIKFNSEVEWAPEWTGTGRVGEWLRNIKDWAISRERYWGTPLPVWICQECGSEHCIGSIEEMNNLKTKDSPTPKELHRPYVDDVKLSCSKCSGEMIREPYVMDCWFDSGCASFAQWHYPFENEDKFKGSFPVDYICEAVDQTRGWFYSLLAVSTTVFDSICYNRCLSLGHILDSEGKKMSKSRGNVVNPWDHFNKEGTDAIRWYMTTQSAPWNPMNFDPNGVRETYAKMFLTLWNVHRFHLDYALLDEFNPNDKSGFIPVKERSPLDRWILSRIATVAQDYHNQFVSWDFHKAGRDLENFVINDLSNWYVRRSRRRLWDEGESKDKRACQHTLHEVLCLVSELMAPVSPFMPDRIYHDLTGTSVHLADWPVGSDLVKRSLPEQDLDLETEMSIVRSLTETGRRIRVDFNRRQRLPCKAGWIVGGPDLSDFNSIIAEELNVEDLSTEKNLDRFQKVEVVPVHKALGKKYRSELPKVLAEIAKADSEKLLSDLESGSAKLGDFEILEEDISIKRVEKEGFAASTFTVDEIGDISLVLDMEINEDLTSKGLAREITRRIQSKRKDLDLDLEATISLKVWLSEDCPKINEKDWDYIKFETRTDDSEISNGTGPSDSDSFEVEDSKIYFKVN